MIFLNFFCKNVIFLNNLILRYNYYIKVYFKKLEKEDGERYETIKESVYGVAPV